MGYRSNVAYIVAFPDLKSRDEYVALRTVEDDNDVRNALSETDHSRTDRPVITFYQEYVKWYTGFSDVQAHESIYLQAIEVCPGAKYRFVAIGEDGQETFMEDGNVDMDLDEDLYAVHKLEINW